MEYIHPHTHAKIIDESITFVTSQGTTLLFKVLVSDKGEDNVIRRMTSPSEYLFNYGTPDIKRHGQPGYDVLEWLMSGGSVDVLRVLPTNAGYAHATINIQTKATTKQVYDIEDALVEVPDVSLRTTVFYTGVNNTSKEALKTELLNRAKLDTIDGYENHCLCTFKPKGRGKGYNNLGFYIRLNTGLENTYPFRLYDFEAVEITEDGSIQSVESPFIVSFDPDAVSNNNESMFIKDVLEKYSEYYTVEFNEDEYFKLGEIVNPHVNPRVLDFIGGQTRLDSYENKEVYFDPTTQKDEDIHRSLIKYDDSHLPTSELNIVDADDEIEQAVVTIDNGNRVSRYESKQISVDNQMYILNRFRNNAFQTAMDLVAKVVDDEGTYVLESGEVKVALDAWNSSFTSLTTAEGVYSTTPDSPADVKQQNLDALKLAADYAKDKLKDLVKKMLKSLDYSRAVRDTEATLNTLVNIYDITSGLDAYEIVSIRTAAERGRVISSEAALTVAKTNSDTDKLLAVNSSLAVAKKAIWFASSVQATSEAAADAKIAAATAAYNTALASYNLATDPYLLASEIPALVNTAVANTESALGLAKDALVLAGLETQLAVLKESETEVDTAINSILVSVFESSGIVLAANTPTLKAIIETSMKNAIDYSKLRRDDAKLDTYYLLLRNYNLYLPFMTGSDGDLDDSNATLKNATQKSLYIMGYKGILDDSLLNKKQHPIDLVMDSNYDKDVKEAMNQLVINIRDDFMFIADTGLLANASQAVTYRQQDFRVSNFKVALFTQDGIKYDEYTGKDVRFTSTHLLHSKIPTNDNLYGIQKNFVGPRRGTINGMEISWSPNEIWMEELYKRQINYIRDDPDRIYFDSQLTSQNFTSSLSDICNVRTILRIKREVEIFSEDYKHEYNDADTISIYNRNLNQNVLQKWVTNKALKTISGSAYAGAYELAQKILRVKVGMVFTDLIERIFIDLYVNR